MKAHTDEEMENYVTQSATYKSAILSFTKKLILVTGGMVFSGPLLALGLLFTEEINKVSKLKNKTETAKKLKAQYKSIVNNIDRSIMHEEAKDNPNEKYVNGLKKVQEDINKKIDKLNGYIMDSEPRYDYKESLNIELNNLLNEYLAEDFYGVDKDAASLETDAIKGSKLPDKPGKGDSNGKEEKETPTDSSEINSDGDSSSDEGDQSSENSDSDSGDDTGSEGTDEDGGDDSEQPDEPKFGNRKIICDRFLDLRDKFKNSLEILYKLDSAKQNEALTKFLENKILKAIDKITVVIDKQIDTIDYNKLVVYDVYFKEIYLTTNEVITTLL
jgi:hypothetical protein